MKRLEIETESTPEEQKEDAEVLSLIERIGREFIPVPPARGQKATVHFTLSADGDNLPNAQERILSDSKVTKRWWDTDQRLHTDFHIVLDNLIIDGASLGSIYGRPLLRVTDFKGDNLRVGKDAVAAIRKIESAAHLGLEQARTIDIHS